MGFCRFGAILLQAFEEASLVVEAVTEKESLKMAVLQSLDKVRGNIE